MSAKPSFFSELKRRNVYKAALGYAVVAWLVIELTATAVAVSPGLPNGLTVAVIVLALLGFIFALYIAWSFEMTPQGMKRTERISPNESIPQWSRRKFAGFVVIVVLLAAGLQVFQFVHGTTPKAPSLPEETR